MALILASGSPRRKELLHYISEDFTIEVSDYDEFADPSLSPEDLVIKLASGKGRIVAKRHPDDTVISADTIVALDKKILGKPHSAEEAFDMLSSLSGRTHKVYTGVSIRKGPNKTEFAESTEVTFYELSEAEIKDYIKTGEPFDKAGGYGIQGKGSLLVKSITGDYYNVMGLPVAKLARVLKNNKFI